MSQAACTQAGTGTVVELNEEYRKKRMRHMVISGAVSTVHLAGIFDEIKRNFAPQKVVYNGGVEWANSCYMVSPSLQPETTH